jgi:hypothetical protein
MLQLSKVRPYLGQVQATLSMKSIIFWDMTSCSPLSFNRRFGGTYRLHLQDRRNRFSKPAIKQVASRHFPRRPLVHLTHLFNHCLRLSHFPKSWKGAKFITLPKAGKDPKFLNLRQISLLLTLINPGPF